MRRRNYRLATLINFGLLVFLFFQCMPGVKRELIRNKIPLKTDSGYQYRYLEAHLKDGSLYFLDKWMTNEALETHALKYADLLVFPRSQDERIFTN